MSEASPTVPNEVAEHILELTERYTENDNLQAFNILHLYPEEIAYPNGFIDSRFFKLIGFNTARNERRDLGTHDGLRFSGGVRVEIARIFADGSTLVRLAAPARVECFGEADVRPLDEHAKETI